MIEPAAPARSVARVAGPPAVHVRGLRASYRERTALADVDLDIQPRGITAVIGPSGCGKSTFLQCLNRLTDLIPGCRIEGVRRIYGEDIAAPGTDVVALRRRVGMIFQKPNPFPLSVRQNLELGLREHGMRRRSELEATVEGALRAVGLWSEVRDRLERPALRLSGGQQQRLCIARALALRPELVLMDEPCNSLDPIASGVVEDLILSLRQSYTLVVVTHDLAQARRIADDAAVFWLRDGAGRLIESGPAARVLHEPLDATVRMYVRGERA